MTALPKLQMPNWVPSGEQTVEPSGEQVVPFPGAGAAEAEGAAETEAEAEAEAMGVGPREADGVTVGAAEDAEGAKTPPVGEGRAAVTVPTMLRVEGTTYADEDVAGAWEEADKTGAAGA
jgi:hypothetical protein